MSAQTSIDGTTVLARSNRVAWREVDDEGVLLDAESDIVIGLNPSACLLWQALDGQKNLESHVRDNLMDTFDVSFDVALSDAVTLMQHLVEDGLAIRSS